MRIPFIFLLIGSLSACTAGTGYRHETGVVQPPGLTRVTLNREFHIRPDQASEIIQHGEVVTRRQLVEYYPHCMFELRTVAEAARTVQPETFTVTGIKRDRYMAWLEGQMLAGSAGGGDYNMVMSSTVFSLQSATQPDVFRLTCQQLDEPFRARHVSLDGMRKALGDWFTLD